MPEMRNFVVTETRKVKVSANNAIDAARIANKAFEEGQNSDYGLKDKDGLRGIWGDTDERIRQTDIRVQERTYGL